MFQKSITQEDMFKSASREMEGRTRKIYEDRQGWHNQFRLQVTNKINEELFKPLFSAENGAPNAPIRVLIGMMILKEGHGISDEQLFESARFNMLARSALGLLNMDEEPPAESTYYLLRQRIAEYENKGGENLLERMFKGLTKEQCIEFGVSGKQIRMDSKLLGSNIARYGRYGIAHETVRLFYRENEAAVAGKMKAAEIEALKGLAGESGSAVTYRSTKDEVEKKFEEIGKLMYALVKPFKGLAGQREYDTLKRVFEEQYRVVQAEGEKKTVAVPLDREKAGAKSLEIPYVVEAGDRAGQAEWEDKEDAAEKAEAGEDGGTEDTVEAETIKNTDAGEQGKAADDRGTEAVKNTDAGAQEEILPRETKEIDAKSVQSPHDPDCHYRNKNGNGVKGYSVNVTETCDSGKLNLIVDVQTEPASMADNHYLPSAVDAAGEIVPDTIERAHTDGAYNSQKNREHCAGKGIDLVSGGMQGKPSKYDLEMDGQGCLKVTNKETGEDIPAVAVKPKKPDAPRTWRIKDGELFWHSSVFCPVLHCQPFEPSVFGGDSGFKPVIFSSVENIKK